MGRALQIEYEAIVAAGFLLQIDAPDLALERHVSYQDRPLGDFIDFAERVVATINDPNYSGASDTETLVISQAAVTAHAVNGDLGQAWLKTHDAGTGPFTISTFQPEHYILTRFAGYWGPKPKIDTLFDCVPPPPMKSNANVDPLPSRLEVLIVNS